jgi:hypothetical protein
VTLFIVQFVHRPNAGIHVDSNFFSLLGGSQSDSRIYTWYHRYYKTKNYRGYTYALPLKWAHQCTTDFQNYYKVSLGGYVYYDDQA